MPDPDLSEGAILAHATDYLHACFRAPDRPDKFPLPASPPGAASGTPGLAGDGRTGGALLHGDCLDVMARLPSASFKAVVTSPPYNLRNSSGNGMRDGRGGKWEQAALLHGYATHLDAMPHSAYVGWQRRCLAEMMRLLRPDGAIFYNHKWRVQKGILQDRQDIVDNCLSAVESGPILDPFIGSGTTAVVAEERGLDWVGIDVSEAYLDIAAKRIAATRRGAAE